MDCWLVTNGHVDWADTWTGGPHVDWGATRGLGRHVDWGATRGLGGHTRTRGLYVDWGATRGLGGHTWTEGPKWPKYWLVWGNFLHWTLLTYGVSRHEDTGTRAFLV